MIMIVELALALLLSIAPGVAADAPYRWLTNGELKALLPGKRIVEADVPEWQSFMRTPEEFQTTGRYVRYEDNFEAHGTYNIKNDAVCDQAENDPELCRRVLVDSAGQHWIISRGNSAYIRKIIVKPLR